MSNNHKTKSISLHEFRRKIHDLRVFFTLWKIEFYEAIFNRASHLFLGSPDVKIKFEIQVRLINTIKTFLVVKIGYLSMLLELGVGNVIN